MSKSILDLAIPNLGIQQTHPRRCITEKQNNAIYIYMYCNHPKFEVASVTTNYDLVKILVSKMSPFRTSRPGSPDFDAPNVGFPSGSGYIARTDILNRNKIRIFWSFPYED